MAFLFKPDGDHGLGALLLESIASLAEAKSSKSFEDVQVEREVCTAGGKFIDILITSQSHVICIENKIRASLYNDLDDYWLHTKNISNERTCIAFVLSPRRQSLSGKSPFISITYDDLWGEVKSRIGQHISDSDTKWLQYLTDLMNITQNNNAESLDISTQEAFLIEHYESIEQILSDYEALNLRLYTHLGRLQQMLKDSGRLPKQLTKQWIYQKSCLVLDFSIHSYRISFDLYIDVAGWHLQLFARDSKSEAFLLSIKDKRITQLPRNDSRLIIPSWPLKDNLSDLTSRILDWTDWLSKQ